MKNEASVFLEWFEKEREKIIDRVFEVLGKERYEEIGCGLVMELHQQALTAAAAQVGDARACQHGTVAAVVPFSGYEAYRYCLVDDGSAGDPEPPAAKKRRGPGRKRKDAKETDGQSPLFPMSGSDPTSVEGAEQ
jgi:hypothetical protein